MRKRGAGGAETEKQSGKKEATGNYSPSVSLQKKVKGLHLFVCLF